MDETLIVIMEKNMETGFLEKELGSYAVPDELQVYIYNTYAELQEDGTYVVYMKLTCPNEVEDWEYSAIYDYYDTETLSPFVSSITEDEDNYNPTWIISFDFSEDISVMEIKIAEILSAHKAELDSVFEAIADKKDEYLNHE